MPSSARRKRPVFETDRQKDTFSYNKSDQSKNQKKKRIRE